MDVDAEVVAAATPDSHRPTLATLRRRNSITTPVVIPAKLSVFLPSTFPNGSAASGQLHPPHESLITDISLTATHLDGSPPSSLAYTSLKDLLPAFSSAAVNSPTAASSAAGRSSYEISIRNRLLKQAAWAYLQPMSASPGSSGPSFLQRLWLRLHSQVNACLNFIGHHVIPYMVQAFHRILRALLRCSTQ